ncbi:MAG: hypothetical protein JW982_12940 [Spirochaetes bacterium]|nr:hypothetical protein [Spirochaetota bacterium]
MQNENTHYEVIKSITKTILYFKLALGVILILTGVFAAIQVISIAVAVIMTPEQVPFFDLIRKLEPNGIAFISENGSVSISATFFSYGVTAVLLITVSSIGKKLLELGINMISLDLKAMLDEMLHEWREIRNDRRKGREDGR